MPFATTAAVDEVDVFASDFASTDDEADVQDPEAAADAQDRTLQREEAAAEREARTRRFHNPLANAKRKPTTTRPNAVAGPSKSVPTPDRSKKRRVTYEQPEDAFPEDWDIPPERVRAVRTSTIVQKEQVDTRLKKAMATKVRCLWSGSFSSYASSLLESPADGQEARRTLPI